MTIGFCYKLQGYKTCGYRASYVLETTKMDVSANQEWCFNNVLYYKQG